MFFIVDLWVSKYWVIQGIFPACTAQTEHHTRGSQGNGCIMVSKVGSIFHPLVKVSIMGKKKEKEKVSIIFTEKGDHQQTVFSGLTRNSDLE